MNTRKNRILNVILDQVCYYYRINKCDVVVKGRKKGQVTARRVYCRVAHSLLEKKGYTLDEIGSLCGLDHSSVLYHINKCYSWEPVYKKLSMEIGYLCKTCKTQIRNEVDTNEYLAAMNSLGQAYLLSMDVIFLPV